MRTILIDLDGVLNEYNGKFDKDIIPPIRSGAKEFVAELELQYTLKLFTTRDSNLATEWLKKFEMDKYFDSVTNIKVPSYLMIDDRCILFSGNYNRTLDEIKNYNVWWKK